MQTMEITVERIAKKPTYTVGKMYVDGTYLCDTLEDTDRGLKQGQSLGYIASHKVKGWTAIPEGRYRVVTDVVSPKFKDRSWARPYGGCVPRLLDVPGFEGVLVHCLHPDMEILTEKGWLNLKGFEEEKPQECWSMNMQTGKMELVPIDKYVIEDYDGELYCCEYPQGKYNNTSFRVTDKHRMLCTVPLAYGSELRMMEAKDLPQDATFIAACKSSSETELDQVSLTKCKLCMHIVADGYVRWYKLADGSERVSLSFHYKKKRKIERVERLLNDAGLRYSLHVVKDGSTIIRVLSPDCIGLAEMVDPSHKGKDGKNIPLSFTKLCPKQMMELIEEYHFADGRYENMKKETYSYIICSTNTQTLDTLQTMAFLCGMSSSMWYERYNMPGWKNAMIISIHKDNPLRTPPKSSYYKKEYRGKVFCVQNRNHTIVARDSRCDVPFVLGNCGNTAADTEGCILVGYNKVKGQLTDSVRAFHALCDKLREAEGDVWLTVK